MYFFQQNEYPESYKTDHQLYQLERKQLYKFKIESREYQIMDQKYNNTLGSILHNLQDYPEPNNRPWDKLTKDHQTKIKKDTLLLQTINAIEAIHKKYFALHNGAEIGNNQPESNCIYIYKDREDNVLSYKFRTTTNEIKYIKSTIKPQIFFMRTIIKHKEDIIKDALANGYTLPSNKYSDEDLGWLKKHIDALKTIRDQLNSAYVGYAYFLTASIMWLGAAASLCAVIMTVIYLFNAIPDLPWQPLQALLFVITEAVCLYLGHKSMVRWLDIDSHEAPLKINLNFYIGDNTKPLEKTEETMAVTLVNK